MGGLGSSLRPSCLLGSPEYFQEGSGKEFRKAGGKGRRLFIRQFSGGDRGPPFSLLNYEGDPGTRNPK